MALMRVVVCYVALLILTNILMISRSRLSAALVHYIMRKTSKTDKKPSLFILCFGLFVKEIEFDFAQRGNHPAKYWSYCAAMSKLVLDQLQDVARAINLWGIVKAEYHVYSVKNIFTWDISVPLKRRLILFVVTTTKLDKKANKNRHNPRRNFNNTSFPN